MFSASVQHVSKKADSSGERIVQVDVEHLAINFISKEVIRKSVAMNDVADMQLNTRQLRRLILTDTSQEQVRICNNVTAHALRLATRVNVDMLTHFQVGTNFLCRIVQFVIRCRSAELSYTI